MEDAQRVTIREQSVDGMVQFQTVPITNMIPNANRQKEYRKRKLTELTAQEREEQRKRNADQQREYPERRSTIWQVYDFNLPSHLIDMRRCQNCRV